MVLGLDCAMGLEGVMSDWAIKHFSDKQLVFKEGASADGAYVVRSGKVRIFRERDGHETGLGTISVGEMFGEMGLVDDRARSASAAAVGEVELEFIDKRELKSHCADPLIWTLLQDMGKRLREMDDAFQKLETEKSAQRSAVTSWSERRAWFV